MSHDYVNVFSLLLFLNAAFTFTLAIYVAGLRTSNESRGLIGILLGAGLWSLADGLRIAAPTADAVIFWNKITYVGAVIIPPATVLFIAAYTDNDQWQRPERIAGLAVISIAFLPFILANPEGLWRAGETIRTGSSPPVMDEEFGLIHILWNVYVLLGIVPLILLMLTRTRNKTESSVFQHQIRLIFIGLIGPVLTSSLYVIGATPIDFTPFGFAGFALALTVAISRYRVLDVLPIARDTVVKNADTGVFVLDHEDTVVDLNPMASEMFSLDPAAAIDQSATELFEEFSGIVDALEGPPEESTTITYDEDGASNYYEADVSTIRDRQDNLLGHVLTFNDITEQITRQEQLVEQTETLTRKNERLDKFTSMVSHDLRSPLNVAKLQLQQGKETNDEAALTAAEDALNRMDDMIDQLLTLARMETSEEELEAVDLRHAATTAWESLAVDGAAIEMDGDLKTIEANRTFLIELLENLFRNAVEHNDESVSVTVGTLPDGEGFYVADDGSGIPANDEDEIFTHGYSTGRDNSGFGLSIVDDIADIHDWEVTVTESDEGGARFEIRTEAAG